VVPMEDVAIEGLVVTVVADGRMESTVVLSGVGLMVGIHQLLPSKVKQSEIMIVHLLTLNTGVRNEKTRSERVGRWCMAVSMHMWQCMAPVRK
jgi:hypothetical protein